MTYLLVCRPARPVRNPPKLEAVPATAKGRCSSWRASARKTRVLTHRIAHLLRERLARAPEIPRRHVHETRPPESCRERVEKLVGPDAERLWVARSTAAERASSAAKRRRWGSAQLSPSTTTRISSRRRSGRPAIWASTWHARQQLARIDRWKNAGLLPAEVAGRGVRRARQDGAQGVRAVPGRAGSLQRGRLRRPDRARHRAVQKRDDILQGYAGRFAHPGATSSRTPTPPSTISCACSRRSTEIWRGRRRRSVHLPLARRRGGQHPRLPQVLPRPGWCGWNRTTAAQGGSWPPRTPSSRRNERRSEKKLWTAGRRGEKCGSSSRGRARRGRPHRLRAVRGECAGHGLFEMAVFYRCQRAIACARDALRARRVPYGWCGGRSFYDRAEVKDIAALPAAVREPAFDEICCG